MKFIKMTPPLPRSPPVNDLLLENDPKAKQSFEPPPPQNRPLPPPPPPPPPAGNKRPAPACPPIKQPVTTTSSQYQTKSRQPY